MRILLLLLAAPKVIVLTAKYQHCENIEISHEPMIILYPDWRGTVANFPSRIITGASYLLTGRRSSHETEDKQPDLPKLPVPELEKTIQRYLEAIQPILSSSQYEKVVELTKGFAENEGPMLQHQLFERQIKMKNWAYEWWLNDMYLNNPLCLPINSNPGSVWPPQHFGSMEDQLRYASKLATFFLDFKDKLDKNEYPVEKAVSREPGQPLCMAQYYRLLTTYRVPQLAQDYQRDTSTASSDHIIVAYRKHFFSCPVRTNQRRLTSDEILKQLKHIVERNMSNNEIPVGILTSQKRPIWADERGKLLADDKNKQSLEAIETCNFIICLDDPIPSQYFNSKLKSKSAGSHRIAENGRDETSIMHQMLHGGGSIFNTGNRWFDKSLQFILSSDGAIGLCYEHSPAEAVGIQNLIDEFIGQTKPEKTNNGIPTVDITLNTADLSEEKCNKMSPELPEPVCLEWSISTESKVSITEASVAIDRLIEDLDLTVFRYEGYGKDFIKKCRVSPDVYIQLALQFAYYSLHGKFVATYESASTRRYKFGRVDCIRSTTMEALEWVKSMKADVTLDETERMRKFHKAVEKQTAIMIENILGDGFDVHLLGLKQQAFEMGIDIPELFLDETFRIANHFALSTSQVGSKINTFMAYGPVVQDGYGASYNPHSTSIIYCISSFHSSKYTSTTNFILSLQKVLDTMKNLFQQ